MNTSNKPQLIYIAYGAETYHIEAFFSIVSALARSLGGPSTPGFDIQVFTDSPEFYTKLPVITHAIKPDWQGPHDYHFRRKHCVIREILETHPKAALIDTDTFFRRAPEELFARIDDQHLLCNTINRPAIEFEKTDIVQAAHQIGYIGTNMHLANSGVIGLTQSNRHLLDLSIKMMDNLYPDFKNFYPLEELCIAMAASKLPLALHECPDLIYHYWSRKSQFRAKVSAWHRKHREAPLCDAALSELGQVNDRVPKPAQPQRALQKLLTLLLPKHLRQFARELLYGCTHYHNEFDQACTPIWWDKALENFHKKHGRPPRKEEIHNWLIQYMAGSHRTAMNEHITKDLNLIGKP